MTPDEQMSAAREALGDDRLCADGGTCGMCTEEGERDCARENALLAILDLHKPIGQGGALCAWCDNALVELPTWPCATAQIVLSAILGGER